jgi:hypothetical protein
MPCTTGFTHVVHISLYCIYLSCTLRRTFSLWFRMQVLEGCKTESKARNAIEHPPIRLVSGLSSQLANNVELPPENV